MISKSCERPTGIEVVATLYSVARFSLLSKVIAELPESCQLTGIESPDMPNSRNAKKELRKSRSRRLRNRMQRSALRTVVKKVRTAAATDDREAAESAFRTAAKTLDQAAAKNLIHRNTAARTKSRLAKLMRTTFAASS